jgi:ABC-type multidrug transport system permease subunit
MEDSFDQKDIEEQKIITKREARVAGLNHTKHLVSICYSILLLIFLMTVISISIYSVISKGLTMWLFQLIEILNTAGIKTIILILSLSMIGSITNFVKAYFKKN